MSEDLRVFALQRERGGGEPPPQMDRLTNNVRPRTAIAALHFFLCFCIIYQLISLFGGPKPNRGVPKAKILDVFLFSAMKNTLSYTKGDILSTNKVL